MKFHDEDDMDHFINEQKQKLARDREVLEKNPTSAVNEYDMNGSVNPRRIKEQQLVENNISLPKQNLQPTNNNLKGKPPTPQFLKLGQDYEKQKEKLKEELRKEYREALAEKQVRGNGMRRVNNSSYEAKETSLGLSLPIRDHLSAKQKNEGGQQMPGKTNESYQDILDRKRKQEKAYRNMDDDDDELEDKVLYRGKLRQRIVDDDEYKAPRKAVRFPQGRRRAPRYEEEDAESLDSEEAELIRRIRRRKEGRRSQKFEEESEEEEEPLFEKVKHKNARSLRGQRSPRRLNSAQGQDHSQSVRSSLEKKSLDLRSRSAPPEEYTGLNIGNVPSANSIQRRKDEYKLELQKQMEDNMAVKKRNRAIELQADSSETAKTSLGNTSSTKAKQSNLKSEDEPKRSRKNKKQTSFKRDSSESGSDDERRKYFPKYYPMPPQPNSFYPPPQMPQQQFQSPYDEAYYYYGSRNPLDPASMGMPYAPPQGMVPPGAFPNGTFNSGASPMMNMAQPRTQDSSVERFNAKSTGKTSRGGFKMANVESSLVSDETRDSVMKREKMLTYQEELKEQMKLKEKKKTQEKLEQDRYDQRMENEANNYNPWGKGGGGAPMRDVHGNLISDLRQMHLVNEDLVRDPSKVVELVKEQRKVQEEVLPVYSPREKTMDSDNGGIVSPRFGRSNPFEVKETSRQKSQRDLYKENLQRQIDERKRLEEKRKEKEREEEEKEERKLEEQNRKLQEEYEKEKLKQREKIEEKLRQNAQLQKSAEDKKKADQQRRLEEEQRREEEARAHKERELQERLKKPKSPPINNELHGTQTLPRTPAINTHRSDLNASYNPPISPPHQQQYNQQQQQQQYTQQQPQQYMQPQYSDVSQPQYQQLPLPANVRPPKSRESKRISRELSALRKQLLSEQRRVENELKTQEPVFQFGGYRPTKLKTETLIDLSKVRQRPVQVRRPTTSDRPSSTALKDFKEIKHGEDTESLRMFRVEHPDTPTDTSGLEKQQEDLIKTQARKLHNLRQGISEQPHHSRRSPTKDSRNGFSLLPPSDSYASLLDADSMMIPVTDLDLENRPPSSELQQRKKYSARDRRRSSRRNADEEGGTTYRAAAQDTYSLNSLTSLATLDVERMASKNQERLNKLKALTGDEVSLTDPDDILDRFVNQHKNDADPKTRSDAQSRIDDRPSSVNTLDTEPWLRPSTGPIAAT